MDWQEFKKKSFEENPNLKKEYDKLELEYKIISQIIDLRRKKKISQRKLASLIKTKQPNIVRFESGEYNPSLKYLMKMADALDSELDVTFKPKAS